MPGMNGAGGRMPPMPGMNGNALASRKSKKNTAVEMQIFTQKNH